MDQHTLVRLAGDGGGISPDRCDARGHYPAPGSGQSRRILQSMVMATSFRMFRFCLRRKNLVAKAIAAAEGGDLVRAMVERPDSQRVGAKGPWANWSDPSRAVADCSKGH